MSIEKITSYGLIGGVYMMLCLGVSIVYMASREEGERGKREVKGIVVMCLVIGGMLEMKNGIGYERYGVSIIEDGLSSIIKGVVYIITGMCVLRSKIKKEGGKEYIISMLLCSVGVGLMVSGKDMISMYLGMEMQSLCLYIIASRERESTYSTEGGLKYYIIGGVGTGIMLMGMSVVYGEYGTIRLEEIGSIVLGEEVCKGREGILLILIGVLVKLGVWPLHMWVPDVYEGTEVSGMRYLSIIPKIGVLGVLIRITSEMPKEVWEKVIVVISIGSMVVSVLGTLYQKKVKRFIGWGGIGHMGFILIGILSGNKEGVLGYVILYMIMIWCLVEVIEKESVKYIDEIGRVCRRKRYVGVLVCILMFSLGGIPPLGGFYIKMYIVEGGLSMGYTALSVVGIVCSVVSGYYYLRWIKIIYFEEERKLRVLERRGEYEEGRSWKGVLESTCVVIIMVYVGVYVEVVGW